MNPEFQVHKLNHLGIEKAKAIAAIFDRALDQLNTQVAPGHMAIVKTKLEEACFFAKKAMACEPQNQEP